jgi:hypothetical protein
MHLFTRGYGEEQIEKLVAYFGGLMCLPEANRT